MGAIWTDEALFASWMEVEVAAAEAMAAEGIVPATAAAAIRERAGFDIGRIREIEKTVQHDVVAFTQSMAEHVGAEGRWIHFGLTSSDVVDTALATRLVRSADLILRRVEELRRILRRRAEEHRRTVMVGRTHGVHAEPMTFGMKLALWWAEMGRNHRRLTAAREAVSVGKLSGAVGTFAHLPPSVEKRVCDALGLRPAAISTQVVQRDRHAELAAALAILAGTLEKIATEIRNLQRTEIRELEEPFGRGQKGSSAMPHKRNPVGCEQVCGLARIIRANTLPAIENIALWNERDISHSSAERMAIPQSFLLTDHILVRMTRILDGLVVRADSMLENLNRMNGMVFSGQVLLDLAAKGISREDAYKLVQGAAMRLWEHGGTLRERLDEDAGITSRLSREELDAAFDLDVQLRHLDTVFERVFAEGNGA
ncbi:MAG: adenylosuccinate lyase [Acidobacteria bacterium]|nr:adenylosuccinate lyase [Acidobacteriota bacterium]MYH22674.1 adenylosuccinate lyase [Acidobacteriota bacterium]MYK80535.1 adenylosuccinate lyase [Acidobacteriota bacterium]